MKATEAERVDITPILSVVFQGRKPPLEDLKLLAEVAGIRRGDLLDALELLRDQMISVAEADAMIKGKMPGQRRR